MISLDEGKYIDGWLVTCIEGDFFSLRRRSVIFEKWERDEWKNSAINMFDQQLLVCKYVKCCDSYSCFTYRSISLDNQSEDDQQRQFVGNGTVKPGLPQLLLQLCLPFLQQVSLPEIAVVRVRDDYSMIWIDHRWEQLKRRGNRNNTTDDIASSEEMRSKLIEWSVSPTLHSVQIFLLVLQCCICLLVRAYILCLHQTVVSTLGIHQRLMIS